jgi:hypothetical protein
MLPMASIHDDGSLEIGEFLNMQMLENTIIHLINNIRAENCCMTKLRVSKPYNLQKSSSMNLNTRLSLLTYDRVNDSISRKGAS